MSKKVLFLVSLLASGTLLAACSGAPAPSSDANVFGGADLGTQGNPVKIGIMSPELQYDYLKETAEKEGLYIEYTSFNDYNQPNPAVVNNELQLNQFQHLDFLANYNLESGQPLAALQSTAIYPLSLYSNTYKNVADIPQGAQVAIPNDETNQARALGVVASAGLITLKPGVDAAYATPLDVDEAASKVKIVAISAEQTPRSLDDPNTAAAIINNTYALDAGLQPDEAIAKDDPNSPAAAPYINVWAGKPEALDNPAIKRVLEIARTKEYQDALLKQSKGSALIVDKGADELAKTLADIEAKKKAH